MHIFLASFATPLVFFCELSAIWSSGKIRPLSAGLFQDMEQIQTHKSEFGAIIELAS
jgi:hypothetical protein